jgi:hypothetical protein
MPNDPIVITREALYESVWSEPVSKIAASYDLSDRRLGEALGASRHSNPAAWVVGEAAAWPRGEDDPSPHLSSRLRN